MACWGDKEDPDPICQPRFVHSSLCASLKAPLPFSGCFMSASGDSEGGKPMVIVQNWCEHRHSVPPPWAVIIERAVILLKAIWIVNFLDSGTTCM